jgi:hypothetical protein
MAALIQIFLENLPALLAAGESLYEYIVITKQTLEQDAAWTDAQDTAWENALIAAGLSPEWQG